MGSKGDPAVAEPRSTLLRAGVSYPCAFMLSVVAGTDPCWAARNVSAAVRVAGVLAAVGERPFGIGLYHSPDLSQHFGARSQEVALLLNS
jgi:hypothetical protein